MKTILLLGAERQAATSAASAYPEIRFAFCSDQPVIDGWDLPNVSFVAREPGAVVQVETSDPSDVIPLCTRWIDRHWKHPENVLGAFDLFGVMEYLKGGYGDLILPVVRVPVEGTEWIVKGDFRHRPDEVVFGSAEHVASAGDPHGVGLLYQPFVKGDARYLVTGHRLNQNVVDIAVFNILGETFCREEMLTAGETIRQTSLLDASMDILTALKHVGWFSLSWLQTSTGFFLTSIRPLPRATFRTMRDAGLDTLIKSTSGVRIAKAGCRFVVDFHYSSYQRQ